MLCYLEKRWRCSSLMTISPWKRQITTPGLWPGQNSTSRSVSLGYRVGWISRLGADPLGRYLLHQVRQAGLDTTRVLFDERYPTGFQLKSRVREGDPTVVYFRKSS